MHDDIMYLVVQECFIYKCLHQKNHVWKCIMDLCEVSTSCSDASNYWSLKGVWKAYSQILEKGQRTNIAKKNMSKDI